MEKLDWNNLEKSLLFLIIIFSVVIVIMGAFNLVYSVLLAPKVPESVSVDVVDRSLDIKKIVNFSLIGVASILFVIIVVLLIVLFLRRRKQRKSVPEFDVLGMQRGFE